MRREHTLWREHSRESALWSEDDGKTVSIFDERWGFEHSVRRYIGTESEVLRACWIIRSHGFLVKHLGDRHTSTQLDAALEILQARGLLVREGN